MKKLFIVLGIAFIIVNACKKNEENKSQETIPPVNSTVTDIDGNVYNTISIGNQTWMLENLKTTRYRNGDAISNIVVFNDWKNLTSGAYCNYQNDPAKGNYGRLYNWYAVIDSRNIAPAGWHVPTKTDFQILCTYLGGDSIAGGKMKSTDTISWYPINGMVTNSSGFSCLSAGYRSNSIDFMEIRMTTIYWSINESSTYYAYARKLSCWDKKCVEIGADKVYGCSVRCIKD